jgi:hypothetical protein
MRPCSQDCLRLLQLSQLLLQTPVKLFAPGVQNSRRRGPSIAPKVQELIGPHFASLGIDFFGRKMMQDFHSSTLVGADHFDDEFH